MVVPSSDSNDEDVLFRPTRRRILGGAGERDVAFLVHAQRQFLGYAHHGLGLEYRARREVEEWKLRLGTTHAGHAGARLRRLAVPEDAVARRMRHRAAAAEVVEQATLALAELGGRHLVG